MTEERLRSRISNLKCSYVSTGKIDEEIVDLNNCIKDIMSNNEGTLIDTIVDALNNQVINLKNVKDELNGANSMISSKISDLEYELNQLLTKNEQE